MLWSTRGKVYKEKVKPVIFWRRWRAMQGKEREGSITSLFLYIGPSRLKAFALEVAESSTYNRRRPPRRRVSSTNYHRWGRGWLYSERRPRAVQAATARGRSRFPARRPPAVPAREASHRACAQGGRWLAFPRRPAVPAGVKNCVTRSERGGHLRLQGTSAEPVRTEEKRCASAPKTVAGNSHLTAEASPSSPEVWRFCAAEETAVPAEAAECLLVPGCEAVCRLVLDPKPGVRKVRVRPDRPAARCRAACVLISLLPAPLESRSALPHLSRPWVSLPRPPLPTRPVPLPEPLRGSGRLPHAVA